MKLPVPRLSYEDLRVKADGILATHNPSQNIPVPIEQILEFAFGVSIIPLLDLQMVHEIDAFTSRNCRTVYVDHSIMEHRSPNRYRFSLAHELGHIVLHQEVYAAISFSKAEEWKEVIRGIEESDREWLEWQGYNFAGLILVPRKPLKELLNKAIEIATRAGFPLKDNDEVTKSYVSAWLGKQFEVSSQVIQKRLDKDNLWPPR